MEANRTQFKLDCPNSLFSTIWKSQWKTLTWVSRFSVFLPISTFNQRKTAENADKPTKAGTQWLWVIR